MLDKDLEPDEEAVEKDPEDEWEQLQEERWPELPKGYTPKQREWRD